MAKKKRKKSASKPSAKKRHAKKAKQTVALAPAPPKLEPKLAPKAVLAPSVVEDEAPESPPPAPLRELEPLREQEPHHGGAPGRAKRRIPLVYGGAVVVTIALVVLGVRARSTAAPPPSKPIASTATPEAASASASASPPAPPPAPPHFADAYDVSTFQKGNIHTHSNLSDGDHPPEHVYAWYRDHGYNFLALTDHNTLTEPARFRTLERKKKFAMITGEEITMRGAGKQVHVNGLCTKRTIGGKSFDTQAQALTFAVHEVAAQGGVALVNHPNWDWALTADDLPAARGAALLEIASGHPHVHTRGDATHLSHEAIWDAALTAGHDLAGVAVDDAHNFGVRPDANAAKPGRAWIWAFAAEPTAPLICEALAKGRLYASTGVALKRIAVSEKTYAVYPADPTAEVEFIGAGGRSLWRGRAETNGAASYALMGGEGYVRARVTVGDKHAWTQPSRLAP